GDAGRRLVVREGVHVDVGVRFKLGMGARRGFDDLRGVEERCGGGDGGELGGELAEAEVLGPTLDEAERGSVPEGRRAAVAEDDLVALGEREELGHALPQATHYGLHSGLTMAGAQVGWSGGGEGSHRFLTD